MIRELVLVKCSPSAEPSPHLTFSALWSVILKYRLWTVERYSPLFRSSNPKQNTSPLNRKISWYLYPELLHMLKTTHLNFFLILAWMEWTRTDDYKRKNVSYIHTTNETAEDASSHRSGTIWFSVLVSECILIFMIDAFTLLGAFARNRHLRKNTTYLIINLTVADLLAGAVSRPLGLCGIKLGRGSSWGRFVYLTFRYLFPESSLVNISLISLERWKCVYFNPILPGGGGGKLCPRWL